MDLSREVPCHQFTLSVRSFQVPAAPLTTACPPSLPSVPTSRATRVTSEAKDASCSTIVLTALAVARNSPRRGPAVEFNCHRLREIAASYGADYAARLADGMEEVDDQAVHRFDR